MPRIRFYYTKHKSAVSTIISFLLGIVGSLFLVLLIYGLFTGFGFYSLICLIPYFLFMFIQTAFDNYIQNKSPKITSNQETTNNEKTDKKGFHIKPMKTKGKIRYCKYCGGQIDNNHTCTSCGKQYLNIKTAYIFVITILCIIFASCSLYLKISNYHLYQSSYEKATLLKIYERDFAYSTNESNKYHKYDCPVLKDAEHVYCGTVSKLISKGYEECSFCY